MVFLTCGYLKKLASKPSLLGGRWGSRFFAVEERLARGGGVDLYFTYYSDMNTATKSVAAAGDAVLLSDVMHVSCLRNSGRLALYTSAASSMPAACKDELRRCAALVLEVETPSRPYFLLAATELELLTWTATLQRLAALRVDPPYHGSLPPVPLSVVRLRRADGSLPPDVAAELDAQSAAPGFDAEKKAAGVKPSRNAAAAEAAAAGKEVGEGKGVSTQMQTKNDVPLDARYDRSDTKESEYDEAAAEEEVDEESEEAKCDEQQQELQRQPLVVRATAPAESAPAKTRRASGTLPEPAAVKAQAPIPVAKAWGDELLPARASVATASAAASAAAASLQQRLVRPELVLELSAMEKQLPASSAARDDAASRSVAPVRERLVAPVPLKSRSASSERNIEVAAVASVPPSSVPDSVVLAPAAAKRSVLDNDSDDDEGHSGVDYASLAAKHRSNSGARPPPPAPKAASVVDELMLAPPPVAARSATPTAPPLLQPSAEAAATKASRPRTAYGRSQGSEQQQPPLPSSMPHVAAMSEVPKPVLIAPLAPKPTVSAAAPPSSVTGPTSWMTSDAGSVGFSATRAKPSLMDDWDDDDEAATSKPLAPPLLAPKSSMPALPPAPLVPRQLSTEERARLHVGSPGVKADENFSTESWD